MPLHIATPLVESTPLSIVAGRPVWLKLDALQPPGPFKIRGIGAACERHDALRLLLRRRRRDRDGLCRAAIGGAGNHHACGEVPHPARGAEVIVHGASWQEANAHATSFLEAASTFIHPFDDP